MSDFTPSGAAQRFDLTDAEWREVVVEHEFFGVRSGEIFDALVIG